MEFKFAIFTVAYPRKKKKKGSRMSTNGAWSCAKIIRLRSGSWQKITLLVSLRSRWFEGVSCPSCCAKQSKKDPSRKKKNTVDAKSTQKNSSNDGAGIKLFSDWKRRPSVSIAYRNMFAREQSSKLRSETVIKAPANDEKQYICASN